MVPRLIKHYRTFLRLNHFTSPYSLIHSDFVSVICMLTTSTSVRFYGILAVTIQTNPPAVFKK
jgi:hypothetical protein